MMPCKCFRDEGICHVKTKPPQPPSTQRGIAMIYPDQDSIAHAPQRVDSTGREENQEDVGVQHRCLLSNPGFRLLQEKGQ